MPSIYRKLPVDIEAHHLVDQVQMLKASVWMDAVGQDHSLLLDDVNGLKALVIPTLEGDMRAGMGDYLIRGVQGEFYPCRGDIFGATYEAVEPWLFSDGKGGPRCDNCGQGAPGYLVVGDRRFCHPDYSQPCQASSAK
ncbi:MAG: hypothetical protein KA758_03500 [Acidimicrobiales bacterium]|jgi:hypothetical protein|nr:hypothetical protein [Acidimicrobiales bacterium]